MCIQWWLFVPNPLEIQLKEDIDYNKDIIYVGRHTVVKNGYYDENLESGLLEGHTLTSIKFGRYSNPGAHINKVSSFTILDENGEKVKSNYKFYDGGYGTITINKLDLTLIAVSKEKYYDGTTLVADEWDIDLGNSSPIYDYENRILLRTEGSDDDGNYIITYYVDTIVFALDYKGNIDNIHVNETNPIIVSINATKSKIKEVKQYYTLDENGDIVITSEKDSIKNIKSIYNVSTVDGTLTIKNTYGYSNPLA